MECHESTHTCRRCVEEKAFQLIWKDCVCIYKNVYSGLLGLRKVKSHKTILFAIISLTRLTEARYIYVYTNPSKRRIAGDAISPFEI